MLKRSFGFVLSLLVALGMTGCNVAYAQNSITTGQVGPRGYTGPRGPAGIFALGTVTTGPPGSSVIINNVGTASNAVLNITIPRGTSFYNGSGAPAAALGLSGDYYIDTTAGCLYGPRGDTSWPGNCQSFAGAPGPQGPAGATGPQGPPGQDGASSSVGPAGSVQVVGPTPGSFAAGVSVAIPVTNSIVNADTFVTNSTSNDGVTNALASSYCSPGPCIVQRTTASTDHSGTLPLPPVGDTIKDNWLGSGTTVSHNPGQSLPYRPGLGYDSYGLLTTDSITDVFDNSTDSNATQPQLGRPAIRVGTGVFNKLSWNYGNCPNCGNQQWGPAGSGDALFLYFNTQGITQVRSSNVVKHADGDWSSFYAYFYSDGGQPDYSGEGGNNETIQGGETSDYFHGTVGAGASQGTTSLPIVYNSSITTVNRNATTADAYMLDISQGTGQMHVTGPSVSFAPSGGYVNTLPIDTSVVPSTAYGNTGCEMPVPNGYNPSQSGSITCTINNIGGSTKAFVTGLAELSGDFPEMVTITSVGTVSGTSQPVTFTYKHPHGSAQTMLWQGSNVIGTYLSYDQYYNIGNFRSVFHIYGASDATHLAAQPRGGGVTPNPYIAPITVGPLTQSGTTVTAKASNVQVYGQFNLQSGVVSGCSDAGFNQNVTGITMSIANQQFTWTSPGSPSTTCTTATLSLPTSLFAFHLYPGAQVYGPSVAAPTTLSIEPNNVAWTQGDLIEMPHHFDWSGTDLRTSWIINSPLAQYSGNSNGVGHMFAGAGVGGQFKPFLMGINNPCSYYIGCGGTMQLAPMITFGTGGNPANGGVNGGGMRLGESPLNNQPVISVGCQDAALGGCANHDPVILSVFSTVANSQMYFYPDKDSYGAANFEAGTLGARGYGQVKAGQFWLNGIQQGNGNNIVFSYDGVQKTAQLGLCQYSTDKLVVGNCNVGTAGSVAPDGRLDAAILNGQGTNQFGILNAALSGPTLSPIPTYTGASGSTSREYIFVAVDPATGIETTTSVHSNPVVTQATLDASDYVSIPCPVALQQNYPSGTTYRVYQTQLAPIQFIGNCPLGTTIKDTGAGVTQNYTWRNDGGVSSAGQFDVEGGGAIAWWSNPTFTGTLDTFITRSAAGSLSIGTTKGASNGAITAATFTGAHVGSGAGLTALPSSQLTGTVPVGLIPIDGSTIQSNGTNLSTKGFSGTFKTADTTPLTCTVSNGVITGCV